MRRFHATDARRGRCHVPLENRDSRMTDELRLHSPENPVLDYPGASCNARSPLPRRDVFVLHEYVFMSENPTRDLVRAALAATGVPPFVFFYGTSYRTIIGYNLNGRKRCGFGHQSSVSSRSHNQISPPRRFKESSNRSTMRSERHRRTLSY